MKKRIFCFLLLGILGLSLCACAPDTPSTDDPVPFYDASFFVSFPDTANLSLSPEDASLTVTLSNGSETEITTDGEFVLAGNNQSYGTAAVSSVTLAPKETQKITFDLSPLSPGAGTYTLTLGYTWKSQGSVYRGQALVTFRKEAATVTPEPTPDPNEERDVTKTPIASLNEKEQKALADYLFEAYIPCNFGVYATTEDLTSASLWASVEALNRTVDKDTSEQSRTLQAVTEKVSLYFPNATFVPEDVRLYDRTTQTFKASPAQKRSFTDLTFEVSGDTITLYYRSVPQYEGEEAGQYATTLKNSTESGYFSFVSTLRTDAVG